MRQLRPFGEASSTFAPETCLSSSKVIATLPRTLTFFHFSRYSSGVFGWFKIVGGLRHAFGLLWPQAGNPVKAARTRIEATDKENGLKKLWRMNGNLADDSW